MKNLTLEKDYEGFSFEEFLRDSYFVSSMRKPTSETSGFWDRFVKENRNLRNFEAAKAFIESFGTYHYSLSPAEIDAIRQAIGKKTNQKRKGRLLLLWSAGVAAACITFLLLVKFQPTDNTDTPIVKPDITTFANLSRTEKKETDIQLILSEEQTLVFDRKETVISYDTAGIVVDKEVIEQRENAGFNQLIVPLGKRSILNLLDGTKVWVNSDSRLIYPVSFDNDRREIYVDGEIYIEVAEENYRPFVVRTKEMDVQVLGTKFNVTAFESDAEKKIVLVSGLVQIIPKKDEKPVNLLPDQMYCFENGISHIEKVDTRKHIAWIDGVYFCENESLGSILQRLTRYYGKEITCEPSLAGIHFSGKLDLKENLSDIFEGISFILPLSYSEKNGKYFISGKK